MFDNYTTYLYLKVLLALPFPGSLGPVRFSSISVTQPFFRCYHGASCYHGTFPDPAIPTAYGLVLPKTEVLCHKPFMY
ncbi:hypothetical protein G7K_2291-t1 [Saitoella complicata NRRL Y-17804]|uniref:Uncharacterized protein n=1 Tax=Saitoella complicata (strain BCRC 22490 / CBS 7301 / JCM 7358 / NBRC 10748 / NRRL Y-17804) TaxID=698492 RepID=A0A0E9NE30_SAICN|nr:hypothetical protein G7K_2291-t1 [Saitoella complicata NRRL Y-17804]